MVPTPRCAARWAGAPPAETQARGGRGSSVWTGQRHAGSRLWKAGPGQSRGSTAEAWKVTSPGMREARRAWTGLGDEEGSVRQSMGAVLSLGVQEGPGRLAPLVGARGASERVSGGRLG